MSATLCLRNRQQTRRVDLRLLRRILRHLLNHDLHVQEAELSLHLVPAAEIARLNEQFLRHRGSTDVITFNYAEPNQSKVQGGDNGRTHFLHGDIFICLDEAVGQARRFRTTWQSELVRYAIHGLLHLCGFDDTSPGNRRTMRRKENRLLRAASLVFEFRRLGRAGAKWKATN